MSNLRVKDIILFSDDFDPRNLITPFAISMEQDVWKVTLTGEEFKTFWHTERSALQWQLRTESGFRHIPLKKENANDLLPIHTKIPGSVGRPPKYDWSFRFCCRRHRPPSSLQIKRDSVGTSCAAEVRMRKLRDQDAVEVEYQWRHSHDDSAKARSKMPLSGTELEWVKKMAADGFDWKAIKARLRLDNWSLRQVSLYIISPLLSFFVSVLCARIPSFLLFYSNGVSCSIRLIPQATSNVSYCSFTIDRGSRWSWSIAPMPLHAV